MGTAFLLFLVFGRVKSRPPPLCSGQALACLVQSFGHGLGHPRLYDVRLKLKRLTDRGILAETEPGLFSRPRPQPPGIQP